MNGKIWGMIISASILVVCAVTIGVRLNNHDATDEKDAKSYNYLCAKYEEMFADESMGLDLDFAWESRDDGIVMTVTNQSQEELTEAEKQGIQEMVESNGVAVVFAP